MANKNMARENSYILEDRSRFEDRGSSIDSNENAFDDMKQLINNDDEDKTSSLPWASFNFINSIIGSGVIGIPYAFHEAGFGLGILLLILVAYITDYSLILMVRCGNLSGRFTYQGIMEAAFGRPGYILLSFLQFIYPFTAMVSYNVVVGDTLTKVIVRITGCEPDSVLGRREVVVLVATLLITIPLCLYRDIARLAKVSFFSLICIAFILVSILIKISTMRELIPPDSNMWRLVNWDIVPAIAIMAFAFMCHHNTFLIYGSIHEANQKRWDIVTHISIFTSMCVSFLFGVAGYATFAGYSQGDLLENYCWDDDLMNFSRVLFSVQILLTFPIECFVTRDVVETSLLGKNANVPMSERTHYLLTLAIIGSTYFISMATDCLGVVLELNGVVAAVPLAYILPAIIYLRLEEGSVFSRRKLPSLALAAFGVIVASVGTLFMFVDFDQSSDSCSHGKVMFYCEGNATVAPTLKTF
ncbi:PREDICTED: putative sodium-coupled neutral amino acid transporter 11 [Nicrophorus vespilloides]|uniref:Putative sodium-coupled neutral amino acid transporter 11 n=1 Tax=Nicrophorus vespilloides TaxID=110193 RepID=A0ABM1MFR4_NICVS|nr:PREDICTED: putative sodium-coupled neutral amino acid transporter 11 [Nicrophorus vespilloides]